MSNRDGSPYHRPHPTHTRCCCAGRCSITHMPNQVHVHIHILVATTSPQPRQYYTNIYLQLDSLFTVCLSLPV
jgi:hypothetical protein